MSLCAGRSHHLLGDAEVEGVDLELRRANIRMPKSTANTGARIRMLRSAAKARANTCRLSSAASRHGLRREPREPPCTIEFLVRATNIARCVWAVLMTMMMLMMMMSMSGITSAMMMMIMTSQDVDDADGCND